MLKIRVRGRTRAQKPRTKEEATSLRKREEVEGGTDFICGNQLSEEVEIGVRAREALKSAYKDGNILR